MMKFIISATLVISTLFILSLAPSSFSFSSAAPNERTLLTEEFIMSEQQETPPTSAAPDNSGGISTFAQFLKTANYSLLSKLLPEPEQYSVEQNRRSRPVRSGHFVPVLPKPLPDAELIVHSSRFFAELGLSDDLVKDKNFLAHFSGDSEEAFPAEFKQRQHPYGGLGWACPYALSIFGQEYYDNDPFFRRTPGQHPDTVGYGDGRAVSVHEGIFPLHPSSPANPRQEMQLKGSGTTPFCRGADGRAVLRSSVREFLAQEAMAAMGVSTTRSLTLIRSKSETIARPWYSENSESEDPDIVVREPTAISTRVAPSFLRVGHLELFARRVRNPAAGAKELRELELIVEHAIEREYPELLRSSSSSEDDDGASKKTCIGGGGSGSGSTFLTANLVVAFAEKFRDRHTSLIADVLRVGHIAGNSNADNCAVGGRMLDYGPFGFLDMYDPRAQSWTGGGDHFAFLSQPVAAGRNYAMFIKSLRALFDQKRLEQNQQQKQQMQQQQQEEEQSRCCAAADANAEDHASASLSCVDSAAALAEARDRLDGVLQSFSTMMQRKVNAMFSSKIGFSNEDTIFNDKEAGVPELFQELEELMRHAPADYTILFRILSSMPERGAFDDPKLLIPAFYTTPRAFSGLNHYGGAPPQHPTYATHPDVILGRFGKWLQRWRSALERQGVPMEEVSRQMKVQNPKYIPREWMMVPAYKAAEKGDYSLVRELYQVLTQPYAELPEFETKYFKRKADDLFGKGGVSHCSCSS